MDVGKVAVTTVDSIFFLALGGFTLFLILLYVHFNITPVFPLTLISAGYKANTVPTLDTINSQTRLLNSAGNAKPELPDFPLTFDKITNFKYENFSISFDVFLNGQYISTDVPRVLMYFDTAPVSITTNNDVSENNLTTIFGNSNFVVYCDPVKNDLIIAAITTDGTTTNLEHVTTVENIPINQPFQITLVITPNFIEVYKNKELIKTYKLQNTLNTAAPAGVSATLYSPIGFLQNTIKIANVQYFDGVLRSDQVRLTTNSIKPATFFN